VAIEGRAVSLRSPRAAITAGIGYLPDDRKRDGLALLQSSRTNVMMTLRAFAPALACASAGPMSDAAADQRLRQLDVRAGDFGEPIRQLSGGNQQKVIVGRWLARDPKVLIFCDPTRGIDIAAKAAIYQIMRDLASRGRGILLVSSDLLEIIGVSDRILVMREGRITGACPGGSTEEAVMALAVGHADEPSDALQAAS
jgi:ribose transport system ATP-binding protein